MLGGFVNGMITSLKNNKRERTTAFDKEKKRFNPTYGDFVDHKKMSPREFQRFRKRLEMGRQKSERHNRILVGIMAFLFIGLLIALALL
ncbi:hypothetical protein [Aureitalea marina]|uniref:Uncharacterized protein n=1 Tax=Aureitalea marina TaxID=930804 RepID=A0A2S7KPN3_9FLAO|nr:hypothetical protein [Aureitalea marina]PQB04594.1 hypothetical protein BST85_06545 [Aureitalea marina]